MSIYIPVTLRKLVSERAGGCCEYCLIPETVTFIHHEIDHIIAQKHGGVTESENLALCCTICNKHKGTDLASIDYYTGKLAALYHPRRDRWSDHFRLEDSRFLALTPTGRVTIRLLRLNHYTRVEERRLLVIAGILSLPE